MKNSSNINLRRAKKQMILTAAAVLSLGSGWAMAYEVWMGTHLMESSVATNLDDWSLTASMLDGININRAPDDTNPASNAEWQTIIAQVNHVGTTIVEIARPEVSRNVNTVDDLLIPALSQELDQKLQGARNFGYVIDHIMIYDERVNGILYEWTQTEIEHLRDQLNAKGHQNIGLIWRSTNNAQRNRNFSALPIIDHALIEASADALLNNTNNQITLLNWLWTNPATINKKVILQIPRSNNSMTQFASTRRVAVKLGQELGFQNGIQSDRLVFLPVTYNDNVDYLPETTAGGTSYLDSITSLTLSLIEQRSLFEGRSGIPTNADADSFVRNVPPVDSGTLIAGWDTWDGSGVQAPNVTDGNTTGTTSNGGFTLDTDRRASTDGTWGNLASPAADTTADDDNDTVRLINGSSGYYDFTLTDTSGLERDLIAFHFDAATFRPNSARNYQLSVLSGDLTVGTVAAGSVASVVGGGQDWSDFDIALTGLTDRTLDANGTVTFRLAFTGGTPGSGGHHQSIDNVAVSANLPELPRTLIAGWDTWNSTTAPSSTVTAAGVMATATASGLGGNWSNADGGADPGRGSSKDTTWGTFDGNGDAANLATNVGAANFSLSNGKAEGELTFTITNGGSSDVDLNTFHMDALAFRPNAARTYALNVLSGGMTIGNVFTSDSPANDNSTNAITHLGGTLLTDNLDPLTHDQHDDIDIDMSGLPDHTLAAGESAVIQIAFSNGTGSGGGHHLYLDNVAFSGNVEGTAVLLGDVDMNGVVDFLDISPFISVLSGGTYQAEADCEQSGVVDFLDISPFIAILSGS